MQLNHQTCERVKWGRPDAREKEREREREKGKGTFSLSLSPDDVRKGEGKRGIRESIDLTDGDAGSKSILTLLRGRPWTTLDSAVHTLSLKLKYEKVNLKLLCVSE